MDNKSADQQVKTPARSKKPAKVEAEPVIVPPEGKLLDRSPLDKRPDIKGGRVIDGEKMAAILAERKEKENGEKIKFFSRARQPMFFLSPDHYILFNNRQFETNDKDVIEFFRNHPAYGKDIWEGGFPESYLKKLKDDKSLIRNYNDEDEEQIN